MGDDGFAGPPAKKRGATRQISKDDRSDSEEESLVASESGSFRKASDEVMAGRRVVKVRRPAAAAEPLQGAAAPNPFASICLVPSTTSSGVPPAPAALASSLAPSDELAEKEVVPKVKPIQPGATDVVGHVTDVVGHGVQGEVESAVESIEAIDGITLILTGGEEEQRHENGDEKLEMPKSSAIRDDYEDKDTGAGNFRKEHAVNLTTNKSSEKGGSDDFQSEENSENNTKSQVDDVNKEITEEKEPIVSKEHDTAKRRESGAVGISNVEDDRDVSKAAPSTVNAATSGAFSFGTPPFLSETPTAFASFSSSWTSFGSKTASGTSLGTGFTFASAGSEGAFSSAASSSFSNSNGSSFQVLSGSLFGTAPLNTAASAPPPANAVQFQGGITPTGEEEETMIFNADATFFEYIDHAWKERGKGEVRVNVPSGKSGKARLLMRSKGNFRLILNASLFPDIKMTNMDSRGVSFACVNSAVEEKTGLTTYALKFKDSIAASDFRNAVDANKSPIEENLNTPGNSPSSLHGP